MREFLGRFSVTMQVVRAFLRLVFDTAAVRGKAEGG
jgi:hypothetical protein